MGNIRKTDSKKRILKAFIEILNTDGFNKMTVSKITSLAHINRGTFYLNYIDKFDLLEEIEQEIFTKIKTILLEIRNDRHYLFRQKNFGSYLLFTK